MLEPLPASASRRSLSARSSSPTNSDTRPPTARTRVANSPGEEEGIGLVGNGACGREAFDDEIPSGFAGGAVTGVPVEVRDAVRPGGGDAREDGPAAVGSLVDPPVDHVERSQAGEKGVGERLISWHYYRRHGVYACPFLRREELTKGVDDELLGSCGPSCLAGHRGKQGDDEHRPMALMPAPPEDPQQAEPGG